MSRRAKATKASDPFGLAAEMWQLGFEAWQVIGWRSWRMMQGGAAAHDESVRMVSEKWQANMELGMAAMAGEGGATPEAQARKAVRHYQKRVTANRKRLSR
ncbi:MAG: hypothetical protein ABIT10_12520 [Alteraurantiacibacter sp.]